MFCEIDPYCRAVLAKHWPDVPVHDDIRTLAYSVQDATGSEDWRLQQPRFHADISAADRIDVICGGFPCQPFSVAGKRRGAADDRHLWPEMLRVIQEVRPAWVIGENVAGLIPMGLDGVLSDLEASGYSCQAFVIPACAVDAPHRRDRVWIVGYSGRAASERNARSVPAAEAGERGAWSQHGHLHHGLGDAGEVVADATGAGSSSESFPRLYGQFQDGPRECRSDDADPIGPRLEERQGQPGNDGAQQPPSERGYRWEPEPQLGRVAHGIPARVDRLRALGNAVVPQVVEAIGRAIMQSENLIPAAPPGTAHDE